MKYQRKTLGEPGRLKESAKEASVRRAISEDAAALTTLAIRSKAHWGYSDAEMRLFEPELGITVEYVSSAPVLVAETSRGLVGFAGLSMREASPELVHLFVEPQFIGRGYGTILWRYAVAEARELKWESFLIVADPNAEAFYLRMGANRIGERASLAVPGRKLPLLTYRLLPNNPPKDCSYHPASPLQSRNE